MPISNTVHVLFKKESGSNKGNLLWLQTIKAKYNINSHENISIVKIFMVLNMPIVNIISQIKIPRYIRPTKPKP